MQWTKLIIRMMWRCVLLAMQQPSSPALLINWQCSSSLRALWPSTHRHIHETSCIRNLNPGGCGPIHHHHHRFVQCRAVPCRAVPCWENVLQRFYSFKMAFAVRGRIHLTSFIGPIVNCCWWCGGDGGTRGISRNVRFVYCTMAGL